MVKPIKNDTKVFYTYGSPEFKLTPCVVVESHISHNGLYLYDLQTKTNGDLIKFVPEEFIQEETYVDRITKNNPTVYLPELNTNAVCQDNENILLRDMSETFQQCVEIAHKKNADYAGDADPFKNFRGSTHVGVDPARGILVRMMDKVARIGNLIDKEAQVKSKSVDDTLLDVINYAAILKSYIKRNAK